MSYFKIDNLEQYFKHYNKSVREPRKFWGKVASENFTWYQEWEKVIEFDMATAKIEWFVGAKVNIVKNCIDRHLVRKGKKQLLFLNQMILAKKPNIYLIMNCTSEFQNLLMF